MAIGAKNGRGWPTAYRAMTYAVAAATDDHRHARRHPPDAQQRSRSETRSSVVSSSSSDQLAIVVRSVVGSCAMRRPAYAPRTRRPTRRLSAVDLTAPEQRVLGALLEKQRTTPDQYPLTLNALRLACNQATNRDPVVDYDEAVLRDALERLGRRRWTRYASAAGSRAPKYRHLLDEALAVTPDEQGVLAVLLLRGPQTVAELRTRSERLHRFAGPDEVVATLERLAARSLVREIGRRPGQKEERWQHMLGDDEPIDQASLPPYQESTPPPSAAATAGVEADDVGRAGTGSGRIASVEAEVRGLRDEVDALRGAPRRARAARRRARRRPISRARPRSPRRDRRGPSRSSGSRVETPPPSPRVRCASPLMAKRPSPRSRTVSSSGSTWTTS